MLSDDIYQINNYFLIKHFETKIGLNNKEWLNNDKNKFKKFIWKLRLSVNMKNTYSMQCLDIYNNSKEYQDEIERIVKKYYKNCK
ncbi:hypothetical protein CGP82_06055 [Campylobacter sp. LR185c]|nr:hypothetical protein CGP82_06055 [Campylobacter sp. LR185c]